MGTKADLLSCLENLIEQPHTVPSTNAKVMDSAVLVQMMIPTIGMTFKGYAEEVFTPYILKELESVKRIDLVWDIYSANSLKKTTRAK